MTSFTIEFSDGYSFRKLIEYLCKYKKECVFVLGKNGANIILANDDQSVINNVFIDRSELTIYELDSPETEYKTVLNIKHFLDIIKIGRKDSLRIIKKNDKKELFVAPLKDESTLSENYSTIMPLNIESDDVVLPSYSQDESKPNCTVSMKKFVEGCTRMEGVKPEGVKIAVGKTGFIFVAKKSTQDMGTIFKFGTVDNKTIDTLTINTKTIKILKGLNGLSNNSTIKIIYEQGLPLKILCHIGCYGKLGIYLKNVSK